jgi:hypothetical protein
MPYVQSDGRGQKSTALDVIPRRTNVPTIRLRQGMAKVLEWVKRPTAGAPQLVLAGSFELSLPRSQSRESR